MLTVIEWLLIIVEITCCILLVTIILLQKSRSEGLGMAFGASMGESLFGARATNVLTKTTIWLGSIFLVTTTLLAMLYAHRSNRGIEIRGMPIEQPVDAPMGAMPDEGMLPPSLPVGTPPQTAPAPQPSAFPQDPLPPLQSPEQ